MRIGRIEGYKLILSNEAMVRGFLNAIFYSVGFSIITVIVSIFAAYPLSVDGFIGKNFIMTLFVITMFFGGGLIPTYLVMKDLRNVKYDMGDSSFPGLLMYGILF